MRAVFSIIRRIITSVAIVVLALILTQDVHIFPGALSKLFDSGRLERITVPEGVNVGFITTSDKNDLEIWKLPAKEPEIVKKHAALILHGNAGNVASFFGYQKWFQSLGISSYDFDYRGFGRSSGWPSESGIYDDAEAAWNYLIKNEGLSESNVVVLGISIGTGPAAYIAKRFKPGVLVLLAPYTSIPDVVEKRPFLKYLSPFLWYEFPTKKYMENLDIPCVIIASGKRDNIIPFSNSEELERSFKGKAKLVRLVSEEGNHDIMPFISKDLARELNSCLG